MNKGEWKQFVRHRENEILRLTNKEDWGHCPGVENLADIGSRSCMGSQLVKTSCGGRVQTGFVRLLKIGRNLKPMRRPQQSLKSKRGQRWCYLRLLNLKRLAVFSI